MAVDRSNIRAHIEVTSQLAETIGGHLTPKEVRFIASLPFVEGDGVILEIGSFQGKSTVILAKSAIAAGRTMIHACDPLSLTCETDPDMEDASTLPDIFRGNLEKSGVADNVTLHQIKSFDLAGSWNQPLRILWIDGDHTYEGAMKDIELFQRHLRPGAIVALHDVLHDHPGPARVFMERMLASESFGDCGLCGSIGWGQWLGVRKPSPEQWQQKIILYKKMSRLIPRILAEMAGVESSKQKAKFWRLFVPHGEIDPPKWIAERNAFRE